jgi:hypothetical protein
MRDERMWTNPLAWLLRPLYAALWILVVGGFWVGHTLSRLPGVRHRNFVARWRERPEPNTAAGWTRVAAGATLLLVLAAATG